MLSQKTQQIINHKYLIFRGFLIRPRFDDKAEALLFAHEDVDRSS